LPSTAQNLVEKSTINAVAPCECDLITLAFDCLSQHLQNIIIVKNHRIPAQLTGAGKQTGFVNGVGFPAPRHSPPRETQNKSFLQFWRLFKDGQMAVTDAHRYVSLSGV
jgi:hypothetical protein